MKLDNREVPPELSSLAEYYADPTHMLNTLLPWHPKPDTTHRPDVGIRMPASFDCCGFARRVRADVTDQFARLQRKGDAGKSVHFAVRSACKPLNSPPGSSLTFRYSKRLDQVLNFNLSQRASQFRGQGSGIRDQRLECASARRIRGYHD